MSFENAGILDPLNDTDLFCLHYVFKSILNKRLREFVDAHNHHPISTENNLAPIFLFQNYRNLDEADFSIIVNDFNGE